MTQHVDPAGASAPGVEGVALRVVEGHVEVLGGGHGMAPAELSWSDANVRVLLDGVPVDGTSCMVAAASAVWVDVNDTPSAIRYVVEVADDSMQATLTVEVDPEVHRRLQDVQPSAILHLEVETETIEAAAPLEPSDVDAVAALEEAGIRHGALDDQVAAALAAPGSVVVVALGTDPVEGRDGELERHVDFDELRLIGVPSGTALVRRIRRQDGVPGRDVTGRELLPRPNVDASLRAGEGVIVDTDGDVATATVDGSPRIDDQGLVQVLHEISVAEVDNATGDISFIGSVRVEGSVHEGRSLAARGDIVIVGNVDRARVDSGGNIEVQGTIMSSVLHAGAERAVAASIADRALGLPMSLSLVAQQSAQLRAQATDRGQEMGYGLSVQVVLERLHQSTMAAIKSIAEELTAAGPAYAHVAARTREWHRLLAAAANLSMTERQFAGIVAEVCSVASDVRGALENPASMLVAYMQASEAEATGTVTVTGKGIFNSRIVAVGGLDAQRFEAVFRGGSVTSNGRVHVAEVGSPAGARTDVRLGLGASLEADRAYSGTVVTGPGYNHRFEADRTHVHIEFDADGKMCVESLAS